MPQARIPDSLLTQSLGQLSQMLVKGLIGLESQWKPKPEVQRSPKTSPISPGSNSIIDPKLAEYEDLMEDLEEKHREFASFTICSIPVELRERLIDGIINEMGRLICEDNERKLIKSVINIEKLKQSDLFFGVFALFQVLTEKDITVKELAFTNRMWCCISEYSQLLDGSPLKHKLYETLPRFCWTLKNLNLSYISDDKICKILSKSALNLEELTMDHSKELTDIGVNCFWDLETRNQVQDIYGLKNIDQESANSQNFNLKTLQKLSIAKCNGVSEIAVWNLFLKMPNLTNLVYQEMFSMAEVICREANRMSKDELATIRLKVTHLLHPYPCALMLYEPTLSKVSRICPNLTSLNLVSLDDNIGCYHKLTGLKYVNLELEECFGMGLYRFLNGIGHQLEELSISCGSRLYSTVIIEGGTAYQLFNAGLKLAGRFCHENLRRLSVAGCGTVANRLLRKFNSDGLEMHPMSKLSSLVFFSFKDDHHMQTCEERLLLDALKAPKNLKQLSLEGNFSSFFDDTFLERLLARNPLRELELLDIKGTQLRLSANTAERLLRELPHLSEWRISNWSFIGEKDLVKIKEEVARRGWILHFRG